MRHPALLLFPATTGLVVWLGTMTLGCGRKSPVEPTPQCTVTITPASQDFLDAGGNGSVAVAAPAGCEWSAAVSQAWITVSAGSIGSGNGTVLYAVAPNAAAEPRAGTITIAGQAHSVSQRPHVAPVECRPELSPTSASFGKDADEGWFEVRVADGCSWVATSNAPWLGVAGSGRGSGTGRVSYTVARNLAVEARTGTITAADRAFVVTQSGDSGICQYSVAPVDLSICMPGGSLTAMVTTQAGCTWSATTDAPWVTVRSGATGSGTGAITLSIPDNYDAPRLGVVMVRWPTPTLGQNVRVAQAGCRYAVSDPALSFAAAGGTGSFSVIQQSEPTTCGGPTQDRCVWSAVSNVPWITVAGAMPRAGDDRVTVSVAANGGTAARVGTISVRDKVVTITQAGRP